MGIIFVTNDPEHRENQETTYPVSNTQDTFARTLPLIVIFSISYPISSAAMEVQQLLIAIRRLVRCLLYASVCFTASPRNSIKTISTWVGLDSELLARADIKTDNSLDDVTTDVWTLEQARYSSNQEMSGVSEDPHVRSETLWLHICWTTLPQ